MPSDKSTRKQRHQAAIKPQKGKAVRGAQATEFVKGAGYRKSEFIGGKKFYTPMSSDPTSSGAGGDVTNITVSGGGNSIQGAVLADGSVPFNNNQSGIYPTEDSHLTTKKYVDTQILTKDTLTELNDVTYSGSPQTGQSLKWTGSAWQNQSTNTGIESVTGYDASSGGYASAITGNTGLKIADDYDSGSSTGIFFEVTDSGSDTIVTPNIVGALTDTNYYVDSLAWNTGNGVLTVGRSGVADLTIDLDGRYPTSDTNTTYTTSWVDSGDNAILRLTAGNTGSGDDDLLLVAGTNITLAPSGDNLTITANNTTNYSLQDAGGSSGSKPMVFASLGASGKIRRIIGSGLITTALNESETVSEVVIGIGTVNTTIGTNSDIDTSGATIIDSLTMTSGVITSHATRSLTTGDIGAIATSHAANSITSTHITVLGNTSGTNSGDQTLPTRASLGLDTDDAVAFGSITCENGFVVVDTTDESGATAGFKYISDSGVGDRVDIGWGGSYGANMELYSKSHGSRPGEFRLIYGTGGAAGSVYYTHKGTSHVHMAKLTHDGDWHVDKDVYAYSSSVGSDRKLKENIVDTKYGLKDVLKLRGVDFDWKEKRNKAHDVGVIAQEIQEVIPEVVMEVEDLDSNDTHLTVDYSKLVPVLIESIKELKKEIDNGVCGCRKFKT